MARDDGAAGPPKPGLLGEFTNAVDRREAGKSGGAVDAHSSDAPSMTGRLDQRYPRIPPGRRVAFVRPCRSGEPTEVRSVGI